MNRLQKVLKATVSCLLYVVINSVSAQSNYFPQSSEWLHKAEITTPQLNYQIIYPQQTIHIEKDSNAFQNWRVVNEGSAELIYTKPFKKHPTIILDYGDHYTGFLTFAIKASKEQLAADAPVRLKFTFAEMPCELNTPMEPYKGSLARSWIQDEIITLTSVPSEVTIPRRFSGRYLKIELLGISRQFDFVFSKLEWKTQTAARQEVPLLSAETDSLTQRIYNVGVKTLKECMQTVYEDGPKRDQRLWIGDLYLESLANTYTFKNHTLTKHCLYALAAYANDNGLLHATLLERPKMHPQYGTHTLDYALIYNVALLEYLQATGDKETAIDLWPVAKRQIEIALQQISEDHLYDMNKQPQYWLVFDWKDGYDRHASMQGLTIWALKKSYELAKAIGKQEEAKEWMKKAKAMEKAARRKFYDSSRQVIVSGANKQISYLSQVWMILSGTLNKKEGAIAMKRAMNHPEVCYPGSPYAYHYVIEALIECGMNEEAKKLMKDYWGGMISKGADTFWEVYDPKNDYISPYNFHPINSYCHAWSCTPVYFINKYPEIFQKQ